MTRELAVAGLSLVSIMQAGRWKYPDIPAYYIRGLRLPESAIAELHRMLASGGRRVRSGSSGCDVLSNYIGVTQLDGECTWDKPGNLVRPSG